MRSPRPSATSAMRRVVSRSVTGRMDAASATRSAAFKPAPAGSGFIERATAAAAAKKQNIGDKASSTWADKGAPAAKVATTKRNPKMMSLKVVRSARLRSDKATAGTRSVGTRSVASDRLRQEERVQPNSGATSATSSRLCTKRRLGGRARGANLFAVPTKGCPRSEGPSKSRGA